MANTETLTRTPTHISGMDVNVHGMPWSGYDGGFLDNRRLHPKDLPFTGRGEIKGFQKPPKPKV